MYNNAAGIRKEQNTIVNFSHSLQWEQVAFPFLLEAPSRSTPVFLHYFNFSLLFYVRAL